MRRGLALVPEGRGIFGRLTIEENLTLGAYTREDFKTLVVDVSLGKVGAVFALEASRLSRCCSDWHRLLEICSLTRTLIIDADGLNSIAGTDFRGRGIETILTPHPGEMARLVGGKFTDRLGTARAFAQARNVCLVLKGQGTLIALPDGHVWVNSTGSPSMAKGGTGDILTGMVSGLVGQFPDDSDRAVAAAVYLHSLAGEIAARHQTEQTVIATDLLQYRPEGIRGITNIPHAL